MGTSSNPTEGRRRFICRSNHTVVVDDGQVPAQCRVLRAGDLKPCGFPMTYEIVPLPEPTP